MTHIGPCTKLNWHSYWCVVDFNTNSWGDCSLSCLDPSLYTEDSPLITNYILSADLMNNLEIGTGNDGNYTTIFSLKGKISDFYLWSTLIPTKAIETFMACEADENNTLSKAEIPWDNWENDWTLQKNGNSFLTSTQERQKLCRREEFNKFVGFTHQMNFKEAMMYCKSFGGELPIPRRFVIIISGNEKSFHFILLI